MIQLFIGYVERQMSGSTAIENELLFNSIRMVLSFAIFDFHPTGGICCRLIFFEI